MKLLGFVGIYLAFRLFLRIKCHLPLKSKFLIPGKAIVEEAGAFIVSQTAGGVLSAATVTCQWTSI